MLGRLNHVAIAVPDLAAASAIYRDTLGATVTDPQALAEHGVTVVFIELGNTKVELLEPLGEGSPIAAFLAKKALLLTIVATASSLYSAAFPISNAHDGNTKMRVDEGGD